jgi:NitT/TauT family transport system substrate-binding protein
MAVNTIAYADVGANTLGLVIHVNRETLEKTPGLVARFVRATQKSIAAAERNPEESISAIAKIKPDLDRDLALKQLKAGLALQRAADGASQPIGWMSPGDWASTLKLMKEYQDLQTDMAVTSFYTNQYTAAK